MNQLIINVHSFISAISNSSSTTYISCSNQTVSTLKEIINAVLKLSGSNKTSDDYFELELATNIEELGYDDDEKVAKAIGKLMGTYQVDSYYS